MTAEELIRDYSIASGIVSSKTGIATMYVKYLVEAMKDYAKQKCKEQRELCKENTKQNLSIWYTDRVGNSILNAPEPKFD